MGHVENQEEGNQYHGQGCQQTDGYDISNFESEMEEQSYICDVEMREYHQILDFSEFPT